MKCVRSAISPLSKYNRLLSAESSLINFHSGISCESWLYESSHLRIRVNDLLQGNLYLDESHPIYNFLFTYIFFNHNILKLYSPGLGRSLLDVYKDNDEHIERLHDVVAYTDENNMYTPAPWKLERTLAQHERHVTSLKNTLTILRNTEHRTPSFACYGLHEWAMLYSPVHCKGQGASLKSKFQELPLRLSLEEVAQVVDGQRLRCTHFDAIRFFPSDASQLNMVQPLPTRRTSPSFEQAGCIHVNMDLFKWAVKLFPYIPSSLLVEALALALKAREVDMRASPYDLTAYRHAPSHPIGGKGYSRGKEKWCRAEMEKKLKGMPAETNREARSPPDMCESSTVVGLGGRFSSEPIRIETAEGRKEYQRLQQEIYAGSVPIRRDLIYWYEKTLNEWSRF